MYNRHPEIYVDDDTLPSLGARAIPTSTLLWKTATDVNAPDAARYVNSAGRDWITINGVMQPEITIPVNRLPMVAHWL